MFESWKKSYERAQKKMERETEIANMPPGQRRLLLLQKEKAKKSGRPSTTNKGGVIESSVRNLYATSDLDEVYANCAPKTTNAIFDIKDKVEQIDSYAEYKKLQGEHEELQRSYETLQKQYDDLSTILKNITNQATQQK
jgi:hypothetical protein